MKKSMLCILMSILVFNGNLAIAKDNKKTSSKQVKIKPVNTQGVFKKHGGRNDHPAALYKGALRVKLAQGYQTNYDGSTTKNRSALSFVFDANDLYTYINGVGSPIINLLLGEDGTASNQLSLFLAPIDNFGEHFYFSDAGNTTCYLMASGCATCPVIPTHLEPATSFPLSLYHLEAISVDDANTMIDNYQAYITNGNPKIRNNGWLYNGRDLAYYLYDGLTHGMTHVQFTLALNAGKVDFVISGYDGSKHMYFVYNSKACVLENCNPCPTCMAFNQGTAFEDPSCTN